MAQYDYGSECHPYRRRDARAARRSATVQRSSSSNRPVSLMFQCLSLLAVAAAYASAIQCPTEHGVDYLRPSHYKELTGVRNSSGCCAACGADGGGGRCQAWKLCRYSDGLSCRLLASTPTRKGHNQNCLASGVKPGGVGPAPAPPPSPPAPPTTGLCDVRDWGAKGDGITVDTQAINAAIAACGGITFKAGLNFLTGTIQLKSNLVVIVEDEATILGAPGHIAIPPPNPAASHPNKWYQEGGYQDYGHSHWADSLIHGDSVSNVTIRGAGTIDGNGALLSGSPKAGQGCKMFGIVGSTNVSVRGLTTRGGGWFTVLATDSEHLMFDGLTIHASRDAMDIMGCRHVLITNMNISGGGDDAVKFGSDYSRGKIVDSFDINITDSIVGSDGCNALQFGSETLGNFHDFIFSNISITSAGKAGIGIVTMDGAHIYNIRYQDIRMENTVSSIFLFIGGRLRRPPAGLSTNDSLVGSIHDIMFANVHATHVAGYKKRRAANWTATIEGQPPDTGYGITREHLVGPNCSFLNVSIKSAGGGQIDDVDIAPPHKSGSYPPRYLGTRPAYGMFVRHATGISLSDVSVSWDVTDKRPPFILSDAHEVTFNRVKAQRASDLNYDIGVRDACSEVTQTEGGKLAIKKLPSIGSAQ